MKWVLLAVAAWLAWCLFFYKGGKSKCGCGPGKAASDGNMTSGVMGTPIDTLGKAEKAQIPGQCLNRVLCG